MTTATSGAAAPNTPADAGAANDDAQVYRLVPATGDGASTEQETPADAVDRETAGESTAGAGRKPRHPLVAAMLPVGLAGVLAAIGMAQGGLLWWAGAAAAVVIGVPVTVAIAWWLAKRRKARNAKTSAFTRFGMPGRATGKGRGFGRFPGLGGGAGGGGRSKGPGRLARLLPFGRSRKGGKGGSLPGLGGKSSKTTGKGATGKAAAGGGTPTSWWRRLWPFGKASKNGKGAPPAGGRPPKHSKKNKAATSDDTTARGSWWRRLWPFGRSKNATDAKPKKPKKPKKGRDGDATDEASDAAETAPVSRWRKAGRAMKTAGKGISGGLAAVGAFGWKAAKADAGGAKNVMQNAARSALPYVEPTGKHAKQASWRRLIATKTLGAIARTATEPVKLAAPPPGRHAAKDTAESSNVGGRHHQHSQESVVIPTTPTHTSHGGNVAHPSIQAAVEALQTLAGHDFRNLNDIQAFAHATPELFSAMTNALTSAGHKLTDTPAAQISDLFGTLAGGVQGMASASTEIGTALEGYNGTDLDRINNPRPNESMADYTSNVAG